MSFPLLHQRTEALFIALASDEVKEREAWAWGGRGDGGGWAVGGAWLGVRRRCDWMEREASRGKIVIDTMKTTLVGGDGERVSGVT